MGTKSTSLFLVAALTGAAVTWGCAQEFAPFNELDRLRVLAIKAEPPDLLPGQTTELSALVFEPDGEEVSYRWSWCPIAAGAATGYECVLDDQDLADLLAELYPDAQGFAPTLDLGTEPTATFSHVIPPAIMGDLCEAILSSGAPSFVSLPDCEERLSITVRLEVTAGDEAVTAVKLLTLQMSDDAIVNSNPAIGAVTASAQGQGGAAIELLADASTSLPERTRLDLTVEVSPEAAQEYQPRPTQEDPDPPVTTEALFMTWFITGGETRFSRTTYLDEEIGLDELGRNWWKTPSIEDSGWAASIFLVLQDERGGVAWTSREVALTER